MRKTIKKSRFKFEEVFVFPKPVEEFIQEHMNRFPGKWTHVFCGKSKIGDLRIDIELKNKPDLVADVLSLPNILGENSQDNIIADPPWVVSYGKRRHYSYALRDILRKGGKMIINAPWSPWCKGLELLEVWKVTQAFNSYRDLVDLWILEKK